MEEIDQVATGQPKSQPELLIELERELTNDPKAKAVIRAVRDFIESGVTTDPLRSLAGTRYKHSQKKFQTYLLAKVQEEGGSEASARVKASMLKKAHAALLSIRHRLGVAELSAKARSSEEVDVSVLPVEEGIHAVFTMLAEHLYPSLTWQERGKVFSEMTGGLLNPPHFSRLRERAVKYFTMRTHGDTARNIHDGWLAIERQLELPSGTLMQFIPELAHIEARRGKQRVNGSKAKSDILPLSGPSVGQFQALVEYFTRPMTVTELLATGKVRLATEFLNRVPLKTPKKYWATNGRNQTPSVEIWKNVMRNFGTTFVRCGLIESMDNFDFSMLLSPKNLQLFYEYNTSGVHLNADGELVPSSVVQTLNKTHRAGLVLVGGNNHKQALKCLTKWLVAAESRDPTEIPYLPMFYRLPESTATTVQEYSWDVANLCSKVKGLMRLIGSSGQAEPLDGARNIKWLIDAKYRQSKGLFGGVTEGVNEFRMIVNKLEELAYSPTSSSEDRLRLLAVALVMRISLVMPLRISNFEDLRAELASSTEEAERLSTASLIKNRDGTYSIYIPRALVKNRDYLPSGMRGLESKLPKALSAKISDFLVQRELHYSGTNEQLLVWGNVKESGVLRVAIGEQTYRVIQLLWPDFDWIEKGINPHSLRHFSATYYLATHRRDYGGLSMLLNDKEATVRAVYAKLDMHTIEQDIAEHGEAVCAF